MLAVVEIAAAGVFMNPGKIAAAIAAVGLLGVSAPAEAGMITVLTSVDGWINAGGTNNAGLTGDTGEAPNDNYILGNCSSCSAFSGEFRNFFEFSIPALTGVTVTSAALELYTGGVALNQSTSLTYQLTSLSSPFGFSDLGTGTVYGNFVYTSADAVLIEDIALDGAAITAIMADAGGSFALGGRDADASTLFGASDADQDVFAVTGSGGPPPECSFLTGECPQPELILTTASTSVPEPASVLLFGAGLIGIGVRRFRRKRAVA